MIARQRKLRKRLQKQLIDANAGCYYNQWAGNELKNPLLFNCFGFIHQ